MTVHNDTNTRVKGSVTWDFYFCVCFMSSRPTMSAKALCFRAVRSLRSFVRSSGQMLLSRYLINSLSNLNQTFRGHSIAPTGDLIRFWRSKVKVIACRGLGEGIHVDVGTSRSIFYDQSTAAICSMCYGIGHVRGYGRRSFAVAGPSAWKLELSRTIFGRLIVTLTVSNIC